MTRLLALVALALAGALAVSGCAAAEPDAATVNGDAIARSQLQDELQAIAGNDAYVQSLSAGGLVVTGAGANSLRSDFVSLVLGRQVEWELIGARAAGEGLTIDPSVEAAARQQVIESVGGQEVFDQFPASYQDFLVEQWATALAVQLSFVGLDKVDDATLEAYFEDNAEQFEEVCVRHVLVATEAEAQAVEAQLAAGADFAQLARDLSTDPGSAEQGGDLGCVSRGQFVAEFDDAVFAAEVGEPTAPVETDFGWHVILVTERRTPDFADVRDQLLQTVLASADADFAAWLAGAKADADVEVDPRYGTWSADQGTVAPPTTLLPDPLSPPAPPGG
ncbi:MAG: peptidylprolyl isomerase [Acidimicrobiales bacterium]|nr:peptidylprolyl isomerase [Acidimicrobiales bacterium]